MLFWLLSPNLIFSQFFHVVVYTSLQYIHIINHFLIDKELGLFWVIVLKNTFFVFQILVIWVGGYLYIIMALIFSYLMMNDIEYVYLSGFEIFYMKILIVATILK